MCPSGPQRQAQKTSESLRFDLPGFASMMDRTSGPLANIGTGDSFAASIHVQLRQNTSPLDSF
ncbi:hypothetical protein RRSWK_02963 [Rhodopirellula sp. SWK7]|nr:hypothetical protein RRSWK_02963 [Rhodopirellula sp. SWK7]